MTVFSHLTQAPLQQALLMLLLLGTLQSLDAISPPQPAVVVASRQLTPADCQLAKTQCPTLGAAAHSLDIAPELIFLRMQYEDSMKRLKRYVDRVIDALLDDPSAAPWMTICANVDDPSLVDESKGASTTTTVNAKGSGSSNVAKTTTTALTGHGTTTMATATIATTTTTTTTPTSPFAALITTTPRPSPTTTSSLYSAGIATSTTTDRST